MQIRKLMFAAIACAEAAAKAAGAAMNFSFDFGIDNLLNEQYFLFHPFPGRTYVLAARYTF